MGQTYERSRSRRDLGADDQRVRELVATFLDVARRVGRPYAIGGVVAWRAYGVARSGVTVDACLLPEDRLRWLRAARGVGLTVGRVFGNVHFLAFTPKHRDSRIRIDLLFAQAMEDVRAIEASVVTSAYGDRPIRIVPEAYLASEFNGAFPVIHPSPRS